MIAKTVGVVILNYNGRELLDESLGSMSRQTYLGFNLYVADDGSTDDSVPWIRVHYPKVKVFHSTKNLGTAGISNWIAARLHEDILVFASNDMRFDKNCLGELINTLTHKADVGLCTAVLIRDKREKSGKYTIDNAGGAMDMFGCPYPIATGLEYGNNRGTNEVFFAYGGCFAVWQKLFKTVHGFDEKYFTLNDDVDLSWRIRLMGKKIMANTNAIAYHKVSATLKHTHRMADKRFLSERNILRTLLKNYTTPTLCFVLPGYVLLAIGELCFYFVYNRHDMARAIGKALLWNWQNLPDTLKRREISQNNRQVGDWSIFKLLKFGSFKLKMLPLVIKHRDLAYSKNAPNR